MRFSGDDALQAVSKGTRMAYYLVRARPIRNRLADLEEMLAQKSVH
jgi:hypothetical protein